MKRLIFVFAFLISTQINAQKHFVQLEQAHGISSFTRQLLPYGLKYSSQTSILLCRKISDRITISAGLAYQNAGASSEFRFPSTSTGEYYDVKQFYNCNFLKLPVDLSLGLDRRFRYTLGFGMYYSFNLRATYETDSKEGHLSPANPSLAEIDSNDFGIRVRPAINFPLTDYCILSTGLLQEFGLIGIFSKTKHYNTYISGNIQILLDRSNED